MEHNSGPAQNPKKLGISQLVEAVSGPGSSAETTLAFGLGLGFGFDLRGIRALQRTIIDVFGVLQRLPCASIRYTTQNLAFKGSCSALPPNAMKYKFNLDLSALARKNIHAL
jgi:hypothetical protein